MSESAFGATEAGRNMRPAQVAVWDPLVRIFHWSLVLLLAVAWISEDQQAIHQPAGYAIMILIGLRVVWGIVGPRPARFADFVRSPREVIAYTRALLAGHPPRTIGHNPLGGLMVVALLVLLLATGATGWLMTIPPYRGAEWIEELHEALASLTLGLVGLHVLGVLVMSLIHGESLVRAMVTGRKRAQWPSD